MSFKALTLWFVALLAFSLYSRWQVLEARPERCSLDGSRIVPVYQVDLVRDGALLESFCCVRCASEWPAVPDGASWLVRDELSGRPIDARKACFVESGVVSQASRRDHTHTFERWADALNHVAEFGGERIPNPFGGASVSAEPSRPTEDVQDAASHGSSQ